MEDIQVKAQWLIQVKGETDLLVFCHTDFKVTTALLARTKSCDVYF